MAGVVGIPERYDGNYYAILPVRVSLPAATVWGLLHVALTQLVRLSRPASAGWFYSN